MNMQRTCLLLVSGVGILCILFFITHQFSLLCCCFVLFFSPENMKKPWSPDLPVDNQSYNSDFTSVPDREGEKELALDGTEEKKEREKKHTNFTLCNVCNIQLNSAAQAQIHYNGKSHQKRLKQLSNGNLKSDNGKH